MWIAWNKRWPPPWPITMRSACGLRKHHRAGSRRTPNKFLRSRSSVRTISSPQAEILDAAGKAQSSLDIAQGPLLAAMFFPMGAEQTGPAASHCPSSGDRWRFLETAPGRRGERVLGVAGIKTDRRYRRRLLLTKPGPPHWVRTRNGLKYRLKSTTGGRCPMRPQRNSPWTMRQALEHRRIHRNRDGHAHGRTDRTAAAAGLRPPTIRKSMTCC